MGSGRMGLNIMWHESAWLTSARAVPPHNTRRYIISAVVVTLWRRIVFAIPLAVELFEGLRCGPRDAVDEGGIHRSAVALHPFPRDSERSVDQLFLLKDRLRQVRQRLRGSRRMA